MESIKKRQTIKHYILLLLYNKKLFVNIQIILQFILKLQIRNQYCNQYQKYRDFIYNKTWWQDNFFKETFPIYLAKYGIIPPKQFYHNPKLQDTYGNTVAVYLEINNIQTPEQWRYDPLYILKDNNNETYTTALKIVQQNHIPSDYWNHNKYIRNSEGCTVQDILLEKQLQVPPQWMYQQDLFIDEQMNTQCMIQALRGQIPKKQQQHDVIIYNKNNETVAIILAKQGIIPSKEWLHDPLLKNNKGDTVAILLAMNGIIPPQEWYHNKYLRNDQNKTVEYYLKSKGIEVPEQWQQDKTILQKLKEYCEYHEFKDQKLVINDPTYQKNMEEYCDFTFAIWLADKGIIPPKEFEHKADLQIYGYTVAIKLALNGVIPPQQWYHNPLMKNRKKFTVEDCLIISGQQVDDCWKTNDNAVQDENILKHLYRYCKEYRIDKYTILKNPAWQNNYDQETFAIYLAWRQIVPTQQFYHDPTLQNKYQYTVGAYLECYNISTPTLWQYDPLFKLDEGNITTAIKVAQSGYIPSKCWCHNPNFKDSYNNKTVCQYLIENELSVPNEWYDDEYKQQHEFKLEYLNNALYGIVTNNIYDINPNLQYEYGQTLAMMLVNKNIKPPSSFIHKSDIINDKQQTVAMIYASKGIMPPKEWEHDPNLKDKNNNTVALLLAKTSIIPPQQWCTNQSIQDNKGSTVAILLAKNKIIPPQWWYHNRYLKDIHNKTVYDYLTEKNVQDIPEEWKIQQNIQFDNEIQQQLDQYCYNNNVNKQTIIDHIKQNDITDNSTLIKELYEKIKFNNQTIITKNYTQKQQTLLKHYQNIIEDYNQNKIKTGIQYTNINNQTRQQSDSESQNQNNQIMQLIHQIQAGQIPQKLQNIDPKIQDKCGFTIAVYLERKGFTTPQEWRYEPNYRLKYDKTTAMRIAEYNVIPSSIWQHDPLLKDNKGNTVAIILASKGIIPPDQWMHNIDLQNDKYESIRLNLLKNNFIFENNKFIFNIKTRVDDDICQICFNEEKQEFIITNCSHIVCLRCFKELVKQKSQNNCPICRNKQWYEQIQKVYQQEIKYKNYEQ